MPSKMVRTGVWSDEGGRHMEVTPELLSEITRQVLERLTGPADLAGCRGLLVGKGDWEPQAPGWHWAREQEYQGDISPYQAVFCTQVTGAQLCDMALGRDSSPATCAVAKALLAGKPVYLAEEGLPHRAHRATANPSYYALLEGYVSRLGQFGVKVAPRAALERLLQAPGGAVKEPPAQLAPPQEEASGQPPVFSGVLTAQEACRLAKTGGGAVRLGKGTILTPLARDILREKRVTILTEEGTPC